MAISVIGGLLTSTALSLLVVPVAFTYVDGFERWILRLFNRITFRQQRAKGLSLSTCRRAGQRSRRPAAEVKQRMAEWRAKNPGKDFGREI
jgi:hypothetical protein